ncbi:MAG: type II toxin-antitoxin system PemK/MazF family toxin [Coriobacteriales bacterium]|jgi:mRNA interferase MazF|nr:type II toxin-antitoxin system PemK/MazF family toxin [Coriobacteriales bacterium]
MKRAELWTIRSSGYASKARPVLVLQNDLREDFDSVVLCLLTSYDRGKVDTHVKIDPTPENGLHKTSYVMTEKLITTPKSELGSCIGCLTVEQMHAVSHALAQVLEIRPEDL